MKKVGIFGPPRSGTSWLSHIFNSHPTVALRFQPLFSYGHKGLLSPSSCREEVSAFFEAILHSNDPFTMMRAEEQKHYPVFNKTTHATHVVFKETRYLNVVRNILESSPEVQIIGIIRNPLATLASWIKAPKEFLSTWDIHAEWRQAPSKNQGRPEEFFGFEKWKEAANDFLDFEQQYPNRFRLIHYDQLNTDPETVVSEVFQFCGLALSPQTKKFIKDSRSRQDNDPYSVFRLQAKDSRWCEILPRDIIDTITDELKNSRLQIFLSE